MNISLEARSVLDAAGYRTRGSDLPDFELYFEDESIMGIVHEYTDVASLIAQWEPVQDRFLREHAGEFRAHPDKAWNIYTVHLSAEAATPEQASALFDIEEDFRGTRKLTRAHISTKDALRSALLPLIPIQSRVALTHTNVAERLKARLAGCDPSLAQLLSDLSIDEIAARLMEGK